MKVCPVCNESFGDEFSFCDLDGTRLSRQRDASITQGSNNMWSLLGIGLLVGALIISAASIIFFPKLHVSSTSLGSGAITSTSNQASVSGPAAKDASSSEAAQPEIIVEEITQPELKKKDSALTARTANSNAAALDPKAAALEADEERPARIESPVVAAPSAPKPDPSLIKTSSKAGDSDKAAQSDAELKKEKKPQDAKSSAKNSDGKKSDDKKKDEGEGKKKKGGGLFGVFKKIFGKD